MTGSPRANAALVDALGSALRSGDHGLKTVPALLKRVLQEESWREFVTQRGDVVRYERFADFVVTPPLKGIGASVALVRRVVADDLVAVDLLNQALSGRQGARTDLVDNIHEVPRPDGTSKAAALRRLRKDAPELHAEVLAGHLSAHAAMLQAGFRKRTISVPVEDPGATARALRKHLSSAAIADLVRILAEEAS